MSTQRAVHRLVSAQRASAAAPAVRQAWAAITRSARPYSVLCAAAADAAAHTTAAQSAAVTPSSLSHASLSSVRRAAPSGVRAFSTARALQRSKHTATPTRTAKHDDEWDLIRKTKDPFLTTLDPSTPYPRLPPNEFEMNSLSFQYGLKPLPSLTDRIRKYNVEQSYYDRRDARIRDHLDRLLRMKKLSKKEMLILIDQIETSHWNLTELQKAYLPESRHADQDDDDVHRRALRVGVGGLAYKAAYKARLEEKKKRRETEGVKVNGDGSSKYGYRKDLAQFGPEHWDYLTPYMILEPEARHLSHLDGAFKYEDRYVLWEAERRNLAIAAKLQRMKMLGIPLEHAESMTTPENVPRDRMFPNARIRRALARYLRSGDKSADSNEFWRRYTGRHREAKSASAKLLARKEAKTVTAARRNIPEYIRRFEREDDMTEIDVGASTVLAQNLYIKSRSQEELKKPSLLTAEQQESAKALLGMMAQRNRLAVKKMYFSTRSLWESLMVERALERKYLEVYNTVGSDFMNSTTLLKLEKEILEVIQDYNDKFLDHDWDREALELRDMRRQQAKEDVEYTDSYVEKMEEFMAQNGELPDSYNVNAGGRNWILDMLEYENNLVPNAERDARDEQEGQEIADLNRELDSWNEFFDVQVAEELGRMIDSKELVNEDEVTDGAILLAETRVSKRLNATREEWKSWKLRPQYAAVEDMYAPVADPIDAVPDQTVQAVEKTEGQRIIARVLHSDPIMQASQKWKLRMAPKLAELDQAEADQLPGTVIHQIGDNGAFAPSGEVPTGSGTSVDGVAGAGVSSYDPALSSAGHRVMDMSSPAERRAVIEHVKKSQLPDEVLQAELDDPMMYLLNEHARKRGGAASSGVDPNDRNGFDTVNPRLGFADDDFRLYDPVLTKASDSEVSEKTNTSDSDESLMTLEAQRYAEMKKNGDDIFADEATDPVYWVKKLDMEHRKKHFLDLDPFGPANTDERRDFDDQYMHMDEEDYAFKKRIDPTTDYQKPLTQQIKLGAWDDPFIQKYDLNDETCELLYMLHRSDPVKYHPRALAHKFKLSAQRVKSQLIMQAIHHRMVANGVIHPLMMEYNEERALEDLIKPPMAMIHDPPELGRQFMPDYRWVREDDLHRVLSEEKSIEDRFLSRGERLDKAEQAYYAKWGPIGVDPPLEPVDQPLLDDRLMQPTRHNLILIDISELPAARYSMAVRHRDGTLREPNEQTYQFQRKQERGPHHFEYVKYHKEDTPM